MICSLYLPLIELLWLSFFLIRGRSELWAETEKQAQKGLKWKEKMPLPEFNRFISELMNLRIRRQRQLTTSNKTPITRILPERKDCVTYRSYKKMY